VVVAPETQWVFFRPMWCFDADMDMVGYLRGSCRGRGGGLLVLKWWWWLGKMVR
jgi:hypothetical protein